MYHIKQEAWFGRAELNGVNCRRLIDQHEVIINNIRDTFIEMNKGAATEERINRYYDKHKQILNERNHAYHCMRSLNITKDLISKTKDHVYNTLLLWREILLPITVYVYIPI